MNNSKAFLIALAISVISFFFSKLLFDCWFEDFDVQYNISISRVTRSYQLGDFSYLMYHFIYKILLYLYKFNNTISWHAWYFVMSYCITIAIFLSPIIKSHLKPQRRILLILFFIFAFSLCNYTHFNFTRPAFLLVGAGWVVFFGLVFSNRIVNHMLGIGLIVLGTFTRNEGGLVISCIAISSYFMISFSVKETFKKIFFPASLLAVYFAVLAYNVHYTQRYYYMIEPDLEYKINIGNGAKVVPLSTMKTERDSMRYIAAVSWQVEDSVNISPQYLRSIVDESAPRFRSFDAIKNDFLEAYYKQSKVCFWAYLVLVLYFLYSSFSYERKYRYLTWLYLSGVLMLFLLPALSVRIVSRVNDPIMLVSAVFIVLIFLKNRELKPSINAPSLVLAYALTLFFIIASTIDSFKVLTNSRSKHQFGKSILKKLEDTYPNHYIIPLEGMQYFFRPAFETGFHSSHPIILTGIAQMTYTTEVRDFINQFYPCDFYDYGCRFNHLKNLRPGVLMIGGEIQTYFTDYMRIFYNLDFRVKRVMHVKDDIYIYKVE